jgi:quercetin dioxygenase-like cupin family protein
MVKASRKSTADQLAVIEMLAPPGFGSPLHVHHREDEWFYVIEGALSVWVDGKSSELPPGSFAYGPRDLPHTFLVSSPYRHRFLIGVQPSGFEDFVRELANLRQRHTLAPASVELPSPEQMTTVPRSTEWRSSPGGLHGPTPQDAPARRLGRPCGRKPERAATTPTRWARSMFATSYQGTERPGTTGFTVVGARCGAFGSDS